ncbi:SDR family NAD(P)-dependent oxidoreductase [Govanella unica]|uniref:SDR family oxidoreductase n=1 Tax=Govanella unica TaxID=2975056 RepID=A0A9X3Z7Q7_9PROT|nr:SDR family NAD(P)-dependent oxidoreductase [Govania unica]MDA5194401.1 SDR family oxidoreductase [Govania unica]
MSDFTGKIALVTGGSSGIGATIAEALGARGATVAVVASSNPAKAATVVDAITKAGGTARAYAVDVRDDVAVAKLFETVTADFGGLDILVNAAGVFLPSPIGETARDSLDKMIDINIKGTWNCLQAATPILKARGGGKVLNFASVAGTIGVKGFALYSASKAAIVMLTRTAGADLAPFGINVNAVAPGNTETPMNEAMRNAPEMADMLDGMKRMTPSGVTFSKPQEIAAAALYLLSDAARPVFGSTLVIDEGISAAIG